MALRMGFCIVMFFGLIFFICLVAVLVIFDLQIFLCFLLVLFLLLFYILFIMFLGRKGRRLTTFFILLRLVLDLNLAFLRLSCFIRFLLGRGWLLARLYISTLLVNSLKNLEDDGFGVESVYFLVEFSFLVVNCGVGEGGASDILHAELVIPLTIEIVYFEAPVLLGFEFVEYVFEVPAVGAVRGKVLYKFEGSIVLLDFDRKFLVADEVRIGHEPVLPAYHSQHKHQDCKFVPGCSHLLYIVWLYQ